MSVPTPDPPASTMAGRWYGAVDVHYPETGGGRAALVLAPDPRLASTARERVVWLGSEVRRGHASKPPYVTAAGIGIDEAVRLVTAMSGPYRLPDALRRVDALARAHAGPGSAGG